MYIPRSQVSNRSRITTQKRPNLSLYCFAWQLLHSVPHSWESESQMEYWQPKFFLETNDTVIFPDTHWNSSLISKNILFALKQLMGPRHFSENKSEKESNPSHLSLLSPNQSDWEESLTYWRPFWDTRQLRSWPREIETQLFLFSFTFIPVVFPTSQC